MTDDAAPKRAIGWQILVILVIALVFRLIMAYAIDGLRGSGFRTDLDLFRFWAADLADKGPFGFYDRGFFADYTPGYLYALWLVGAAGHALGSIGDLIKLPSILTDVALGFIVYLMARDLGVSERRATIAGAVVVFNPITWFDSVTWGQVDSFGTVFLLLAIRELWRARTERAAILAVVAALVKPQLAILVPIIAVVTIRRALWPDGGYGDEGPPSPSGFAWERRTRGPIRILTTAVAGFVTAVVVAAPFGLSVVSVSGSAPFIDSSLVRLLLSTAATYSYVTVNAYNLWALFPVGGQSMATSGGWIPDTSVPNAGAWAAIGPLPAVAVGAVALVAIAIVVSIVVARRPDRLTILIGVCALALAFFAVPTRVHERYLFPLFALAAILFAFSWRWRIAYVVASVATFLNMYVVLTTIYGDNPSITDWLGMGEAIRSFWGVAVIAVLNTVVLLWGLAQLRRGAATTLAAELAASRLEDDWNVEVPASVAPVGAAAGALPATGAAGAASAVAVADPARPRRLVPAWFDRPSWTELGPIAWLGARIGETPIRPDRSALLARERGGRLDRLDLWFLVVLVVAAMGLRMFRLAEPARMHFDEVYHARTAAEFLQDWRYGISHDIYEWTHPHLAKYAMAAGIVLFAGHDVAASSDLGVPVRDAAIEPRRADPLSATARDGERVWVVTGSELVGYDLATREKAPSWSVPGASAVAYDDSGQRLLVGTDDGELLALDVTALDGLPVGGAAQAGVAPETVGTFGGAVSRLAVFDDGQHVAARLPDGVVAVMDTGTGEVTGSAKVAGVADMTAAGSGDAVVATLADVTDPATVATELSRVLGGAKATYRAQLSKPDRDTVVIDSTLDANARTRLQAAIDAGSLPGITIDKVSQVAVAGSAGVSLVTIDGTVAATVPLRGGAAGVALVSNVDEGTQLYATTVDPPTKEPRIAIISMSGDSAKVGPTLSSTMRLPGAGSRVLFDPAAEMVEVVGATPDGTGTTVYVIEPHGKSVFADHKLPFTPSAWVLDHDADYPTANRNAILAFAADGTTASLDIGSYPFAWRMPGMLAGALTVGLLFLLARVLFRRRSIAVLVGLFALLDGMFFVQSRIAMNDVYTGLFIVAAYVLFAWLWIEKRPRWAFWTLLPAIGVLLGLALASKWVAAYAIGALGILILARSALGRIVLIGGMIGLTGVLGWMAMAVPANTTASGNLTFMLIMVALTLATVVVTVYHPVAWSDEEIRLAVAGPALLGTLIALGAIALGKAEHAYTLGPLSATPLELGFALIVVGFLAYLTFQVAGRLGFGPMAPPPGPTDPRRRVPRPRLPRRAGSAWGGDSGCRSRGWSRACS